MLWSDWLVFILSVLMVANVLLQQSKDDLQDAFSGDKSELFKTKKARGLDAVLNITMAVFSVLFVTFIIVSRVLITKGF